MRFVAETLELHKELSSTDRYKINVTETGEEVGGVVSAGRAVAEDSKMSSPFFMFKDEGVNNSSLSNESVKGLATGLIAPEFYVSMNSSFAKAALGNGFPTSENSIEAERDHIWKDWIRNGTKNEQ